MNKIEKATFAAGCFWGVEELFRQTPGVIKTRAGYTGGQMPNPKYEDVCGDETGHAEAVEIEYDPEKVPYDKLLEIFWHNHDYTTLNRQGPDVGTQYRSVIFYHTEAQAEAAKKSKPAGAVTQIVPANTFYQAEDYHQQYLAKRGLKVC